MIQLATTKPMTVTKLKFAKTVLDRFVRYDSAPQTNVTEKTVLTNGNIRYNMQVVHYSLLVFSYREYICQVIRTGQG